jgi:hypothetical protein
MPKPTRAARGDRVSEIYDELQVLRAAEPDQDLRGYYQAALSRLDSLLYQLDKLTPPVTVNPAPAPSTIPAAGATPNDRAAHSCRKGAAPPLINPRAPPLFMAGSWSSIFLSESKWRT